MESSSSETNNATETFSVNQGVVPVLNALQEKLQSVLLRLMRLAQAEGYNLDGEVAEFAVERIERACSYLVPPIEQAFNWTFNSRERSNFTYDLESKSERYLISMINVITGIDVATLEKYSQELKTDSNLSDHILSILPKSPDYRLQSDPIARYGRRMGWYLFVRALKPTLVIETGVDQGLGSCVICSALMKNIAEGFPGRYIGTEINPKSGILLSGVYSSVGEIIFGDSIESLSRIREPIGLFINDSDHSKEYEEREYQIIKQRLRPSSVVIGDNAHVTSALQEFALASCRRYLFWSEKPADHWYPGGGMGVAF